MSSPTGLDSRGDEVSPDVLEGDEQRLQEEDEGARTEKSACDRCRRRKVKCNRVRPCAQCTKSAAQCTFEQSYQVKERKRRILVSDVYESRLEQISDKIDELRDMMKGMNHDCSSREGKDIEIQSARREGLPADTRRQFSSEPQCIESTLFEHVVFAAKFIQGTVDHDPHSQVSAEITSVLDNLWSTIKTQKQQNEALEGSRLFPSTPSLGSNFKSLPIPPMDCILACLRIAQDRLPCRLYWPFEFGSIGDCTTYIVKACSPGPVKETELIIVHYVLYWLFTECSTASQVDSKELDYKAQALICSNSLEIILSNLSIHIATNTDSIRAMYMATLYCLQHNKPHGAWTFISRAAFICQDLGLNNSYTMLTEPPEQRQPKLRLFWAVYAIEKAVALRLGRPSTIRDRDITVPQVHLDREMASLAYARLPDWIGVANFYGRVYDDIYSPGALAQRGPVRESRIMALGVELEGILATREVFYRQPNKWSSHVIHSKTYSLMVHATKTTDYSTLACIYKATQSTEQSPSSPRAKCLNAARASLDSAEACIALLANTETNQSKRSSAVDAWIIEAICLSSFMPFLIMFGNIIETWACSQPEVNRLQRYVRSLQVHPSPSPSTDSSSRAQSQPQPQSTRPPASNEKLRIFETLCTLAEKFVEAKSRAESDDMDRDGNQVADFDSDLNLDLSPYFDDSFHWLLDTPFPSLPGFSMPGIPAVAGGLDGMYGTGTAGEDAVGVQVDREDFVEGMDFG